MHTLRAVSLALATLLFAPRSAHADLDVVATLPALAALAAEVGGASVTVRSLSSEREDPHFVDARPDFIVALSRTDLLIANGLELEVGWLPTLQTQSRNPAVQTGGAGYLDASGAVDVIETATGPVDRSMGDVHPGGNPHYLLDPRRAADVALAIGARFAQLDATHAAVYLTNAATLASQLDAAAAELTARFAALPADDREVVTYHRSFVYFADWLDLTVVIEVEPRPGVAPDPGHVATVLSTMRASGTTTILQESWYPSNTSTSLAQLAGGDVISVSGGPDFAGGESYLAWIRAVAEDVHAALSR